METTGKKGEEEEKGWSETGRGEERRKRVLKNTRVVIRREEMKEKDGEDERDQEVISGGQRGGDKRGGEERSKRDKTKKSKRTKKMMAEKE